MTKKMMKLLVLALVFMMALTGCKLVKVDQQMDDNEVVAEYDGGTILKVDAMKEYEDIAAMYEANGYGELLKDAETVKSFKRDVLDYMVQERIFAAKAKEFGLEEIDEQKRVELVQNASAEFKQLVDMYMPSFRQDGDTDDDARAATEAYLEQYMGVNEKVMQNYALSDYKQEQLFNYVTKDVVLSEEALKATYDETVEADKSSYEEDPYAFETAVTYGDLVTWVPEGYRTVKHILLKNPEDLENKMYELEDALSHIELEIENRANPEDPAAGEEVADDGEGDSPDIVNEGNTPEEGVVQGATLDNTEADGEVPAADEEVPAADEEVPAADDEALEVSIEPVSDDEAEDADLDLDFEEDVADEEAEEEDLTGLTMEELTARKAEVEKQIADLQDEIKAALAPKAAELQAKIDAGEDFAALIAEYGEDPGMKQEPTMTVGYYVSATSTMWDPAFTEGAMALEKVGDVSGPVYGQSGIHFIRYETDVTPGPVDYDSVKEELRETALDDAKSAEYEKITQGWVDNANVKLYPERM